MEVVTQTHISLDFGVLATSLLHIPGMPLDQWPWQGEDFLVGFLLTLPP